MIAKNSQPEETPEPPENEGGLGGSALRAKGTRDTRLLERAAREKWPIKPEMRGEIIDRQMAIIRSGECSPREQTSAAKFMLEVDKFNQGVDAVSTQINIQNNGGEVKVVHDENWYGNAHRLPPEAS